MGKYDKLVNKILQGRSDKNIKFKDLTGLLKHLGFTEHIRGSHHMFRKEGISEKQNIQKSGAKAKGYQVKQIRNLLLKYNLGEHS